MNHAKKIIDRLTPSELAVYGHVFEKTIGGNRITGPEMEHMSTREKGARSWATPHLRKLESLGLVDRVPGGSKTVSWEISVHGIEVAHEGKLSKAVAASKAAK